MMRNVKDRRVAEAVSKGLLDKAASRHDMGGTRVRNVGKLEELEAAERNSSDDDDDDDDDDDGDGDDGDDDGSDSNGGGVALPPSMQGELALIAQSCVDHAQTILSMLLSYHQKHANADKQQESSCGVLDAIDMLQSTAVLLLQNLTWILVEIPTCVDTPSLSNLISLFRPHLLAPSSIAEGESDGDGMMMVLDCMGSGVLNEFVQLLVAYSGHSTPTNSKVKDRAMGRADKMVLVRSLSSALIRRPPTLSTLQALQTILSLETTRGDTSQDAVPSLFLPSYTIERTGDGSGIVWSDVASLDDGGHSHHQSFLLEALHGDTGGLLPALVHSLCTCLTSPSHFIRLHAVSIMAELPPCILDGRKVATQNKNKNKNNKGKNRGKDVDGMVIDDDDSAADDEYGYEEPRTAALECLSITSKLMEIFLLQPSLYTERDIAGRIESLVTLLRRKYIPRVYLTIVGCFALGLLHVKFRPVQDQGVVLLVAVIESTSGVNSKGKEKENKKGGHVRGAEDGDTSSQDKRLSREGLTEVWPHLRRYLTLYSQDNSTASPSLLHLPLPLPSLPAIYRRTLSFYHASVQQGDASINQAVQLTAVLPYHRTHLESYHSNILTAPLMKRIKECQHRDEYDPTLESELEHPRLNSLQKELSVLKDTIASYSGVPPDSRSDHYSIHR